MTILEEEFKQNYSLNFDKMSLLAIKAKTYNQTVPSL